MQQTNLFNKVRLGVLNETGNMSQPHPTHPHGTHPHHKKHHQEPDDQNVPETADPPAVSMETNPEIPAATEKPNTIQADRHSDIPEIVVEKGIDLNSGADKDEAEGSIHSGSLPSEGNKSEPLKHEQACKKKQKELKPGQIYSDPDRLKWEERYNCRLSMVGFAVGLTNILRFPYLCFEHGGGAFLVPYFLFLFICAIPVMYLEVIVGQFTQCGMISVWKLVPIFRGVGVCQTILPFLISFYYHTILAWALLYCVESFLRFKVPWVGCHHPWNTLHCRDIPPDFEIIVVKDDERRAGAEFFRGRVQRKWKSMYVDDDITTRSQNGNGSFGLGPEDSEGLGPPNLDVSLYLLAIYIAVLIFLARGLRIRGKSIWISVIAPYFMMLVLVYRGLALPGAWNGVTYLFNPLKEKLGDLNTWKAAAQQIFLSCGSGIGIHLTFSSHNRFNHNALKDAVSTALINALTSIICAIIVFIALGNIAYSDNTEIEKLIGQGPDLVFEVCADALGRLPGASFYSFIFFLMILLMGFESSLGGLVCSVQSLFDVAGDWFDRNGKARGTFITIMMAIAYGFGLSCATRGGLHMFIFLDTFTALEPLLFCSFLLVVSFTWIYGLHEICDAAEAMIGRRPNFYFQVCWKFISPVVILGILVFSLYDKAEATYVEGFGTNIKKVRFEERLQIIGTIYAHLPESAIVIGVAWCLYKSRGRTFKEKLLLGISPESEHDEILATGTSKRATLKHYLYYPDFRANISSAKVYPEESFEPNDVHFEYVESHEPESQIAAEIPEEDDNFSLKFGNGGSNESFRTQIQKM